MSKKLFSLFVICSLVMALISFALPFEVETWFDGGDTENGFSIIIDWIDHVDAGDEEFFLLFAMIISVVGLILAIIFTATKRKNLFALPLSFSGIALLLFLIFVSEYFDNDNTGAGVTVFFIAHAVAIVFSILVMVYKERKKEEKVTVQPVVNIHIDGEEKKYCFNCGAVLEKEDVFCGHCGTSVKCSVKSDQSVSAEKVDEPIEIIDSAVMVIAKEPEKSAVVENLPNEENDVIVPKSNPSTGKKDRSAICPHCGARQSPDMDNCKYCGTKMR